jgi:hypothetical protein
MTRDVAGDPVDLEQVFHRGDDPPLYQVRAAPIMATA